MIAAAGFAFMQSCQKFEEPAAPDPVQMIPNMSLADFKALYKGTPLEITSDTIVLSGQVISSDKSGNIYRSLYIQDGTAGLEVKIGKTGLYNDYMLGQTVYIMPKYLCLGTYGGSVQLGAVSADSYYETSYIDVQALIDRTIFKGSHGEPPAPMEITSSSQITEANVCKYVKLVNASYQGGQNGLRTWAVSSDPLTGAEAEYGQQNFSVDGRTVVVRTSGYASFADYEVGMETGDKCDITGILTKYRDTYQLVLLDIDGVKKYSKEQ